MSLRDQILAAAKRPLAREEVAVPEWGLKVWVREMPADERDAFEAVHVQDPTTALRARLAAATLCDEAGSPLFTVEDVVELGKASGAALGRIFKVATRLNAMRREDIDELEGNSAAIPSASTPSASPNGSE